MPDDWTSNCGYVAADVHEGFEEEETPDIVVAPDAVATWEGIIGGLIERWDEIPVELDVHDGEWEILAVS
jgi:hypothetical protein